MKILLIVLCGLLLNIGQTSFLKLSKDEVALSIDHTATDAQLSSFKQQLAKRKIVLDVTGLKRDADQKISYIKISVNCGDGFKGNVGKALTEKDATIGFYRSYKVNASSPFGMQPKPL
jgi:septum formation inhibitor MinC